MIPILENLARPSDDVFLTYMLSNGPAHMTRQDICQANGRLLLKAFSDRSRWHSSDFVSGLYVCAMGDFSSRYLVDSNKNMLLQLQSEQNPIVIASDARVPNAYALWMPIEHYLRDAVMRARIVPSLLSSLTVNGIRAEDVSHLQDVLESKFIGRVLSYVGDIPSRSLLRN